jgi:hypothetical protein
MIMDLVEDEFEIEEIPLHEVFEENMGKHWRRGLSYKINSVRNTVISDIREGEVDPKESDHPFRFMANSIVIHVLEQSIVGAGIYEDLREARKEGVHEKLNQRLTKYHQDREGNDDQ